MFWPRAEADPTEIVVTISVDTFHVVTSVILFDRFLAFRTGLCVCLNPLHVFILWLTFCLPLMVHLTVTWLVRKLFAGEAWRDATLAVHFLFSWITPSLEAVLTSWFRTPLNRFVVVCIWLAKPLPVELLVFWAIGKKFDKDAMTDFKIASCLHTRCLDPLRSIIDQGCQMILHAVYTECMLTLEGKFVFVG